MKKKGSPLKPNAMVSVGKRSDRPKGEALPSTAKRAKRARSDAKASTKACEFPPGVKAAIYERDGGRCVICGAPGAPNAHYIPRSQLGLGIVENGVTLCASCHRKYDHTGMRTAYGKIIRQHLDRFYPGFPDEDRVYHKLPKELRL